jgi:hypothetical protein
MNSNLLHDFDTDDDRCLADDEANTYAVATLVAFALAMLVIGFVLGRVV